MTHHRPHLPQPVPMEEGLLAWTRGQGPDMWHEIACGIDFAEPHATIDLMLAAQWITRQDGCCRATALLLLARLLAADFHHEAPPHMAPEAARIMARELHRRLAQGRFPVARFRLSPGQMALVQAVLGDRGAMPLPAPALTDGTEIAHPPHAFLGWRPVSHRRAARPALRLVA